MKAPEILGARKAFIQKHGDDSVLVAEVRRKAGIG